MVITGIIRNCLVALAAIALLCETANAKDSNQLTLKTERAIVFKDGYCLIVKSATGKTDESGAVFTEEVPDAAVLGSFWATSESGKIKSMVAGWGTTNSVVNRDCANLADVIMANIGKQCSFETTRGKSYEGKIVRLLQQQGSSDPFSSSTLFVLSTQSGDVAIEISEVRGLQIDAMQHTLSYRSDVDTKHKTLTMRFDKPNTQISLQLMYFRPDVRWIPTYRIELSDASVDAPKGHKGDFKQATVAMQAELINDAEDLIDVPIHIVVGVPNFRFKDTPSPLTLESTIRQTVPQAIQSQLNLNNFSNAAYSQRAAADFGSVVTPSSDVPAELSQSSGNDLVVYELDAMSLKKGERATVPIASDKAAYRDIYTWTLDVVHSETYAQEGQSGRSPLQLSGNRVWRQVELVNETKLPWTTGAAMFVDGFQPLAQELLTYTSPGQLCRVPVTIAVDLQGKAVDEEVGRKTNAYKWRGRSYAEIDGQITLDLQNNKLTTVPVEIELRFGGKATQISDDGTSILSAFRSQDWLNGQGDRLNNSSTVKWTTTLEAGACFKPTSEYKFSLQY